MSATCNWYGGCEQPPLLEWDETLCAFHFDACERRQHAERQYAHESRQRGTLVPHPTEYVGIIDRELIDYERAFRLACAFDDGWYKAVERIFGGVCRDRASFDALHQLHQLYRPRYAQLRDYLHGEYNVPLVLAARIALHMTRREIDRWAV